MIVTRFENRNRTVPANTRNAGVRFILGIVVGDVGVSLEELRRGDPSAPRIFSGGEGAT
jgi:hypothetical protein